MSAPPALAARRRSRRAARWARRAALGAAGLLGLTLAVGLLLDRLYPLPLDRLPVTGRSFVDRHGAVLAVLPTPNVPGAVLEGGRWRLPLAPDQVDPLYRRILIAVEDQRFDTHPGVDPWAILRAIGQNAAERRIVSGASTLTMQTARLIEPRSGRTLGAKAWEAFRALQLGAHLTRDEVLGLYMTHAPMGGTVDGVRAASLIWFGHEPATLTAAEAALLVALPRAPSRLRPDRNPEAARKARNAVLDKAEAAGILTRAEADLARATGVPRRRTPMPDHGWHTARRFCLPLDGPVCRATLNAEMQREAELRLAQHVAGLGPGLAAAALIVDNRSAQVLAAVGSSGRFDADRGGAIDFLRAVRSPGSTLKPFIYAAGFDAGWLHPDTRVEDRPTRFGPGYDPGNFEPGFSGEVTVREALRRSLNVPVVAVLERVTPLAFEQSLRRVGARLIRPDGAPPALPIALGGVGIRLTELTQLYAGLANDGRVRPLRWRADEPLAPPATLVGPRAAWFARSILAETQRPAGLPELGQGRPLGFKTGTSYGFRDALSIVFDRGYTVAVWVGRPDGQPAPALVGVQAAAPLAFSLAELLPPAPEPVGPPPPGTITEEAKLPPALRSLQRQGDRLTAITVPGARGAELVLRFPADGAVLRTTGGPLPVEAAGGRAPYTWLVDGRPLAAPSPDDPVPQGPLALWTPASAGFAEIVVVDDEGRSARARVKVETVGP